MSDHLRDQERTEQAILEQACGCAEVPGELTRRIVRLQILTVIWMVVECGLALLSAWRAHSPVLLAFGADSLIELLSAMVVLLQFIPSVAVSPARAMKIAGSLLFVLAAVITIASGLALWQKVQPDTSWLGMGVTVWALVIMPVLSMAEKKNR